MLKLTSDLRKLRGRPLADWVALLRAAALLLGVRLALAVLPYRHVEARLRPGGAARRRAPSPEAHRRTIWAVEAAARRLLPSRPCLTQALVARWLLGRQALATELRIGVAKTARGLAAHAWLERDGRVILGGNGAPRRYSTIKPLA